MVERSGEVPGVRHSSLGRAEAERGEAAQAHRRPGVSPAIDPEINFRVDRGAAIYPELDVVVTNKDSNFRVDRGAAIYPEINFRVDRGAAIYLEIGFAAPRPTSKC